MPARRPLKRAWRCCRVLDPRATTVIHGYRRRVSQRGPHEHTEQADFFCFIGPSNFKLRLWDNRPASETYRNVMTLFVGADSPKSVLVPKGVVHAYRNVGHSVGIVINFPNRLFMGANRSAEVDEIRHEDDPETIFRIDD